MSQIQPIQHLPSEIISRIFLAYAEDCRTEYENARWNDYEQKPYRWLVISHVCRRWREVALRYPMLWDWIVPIRRACTRVFLQRSGERPLHVPYRRMREPSHSEVGPKFYDNLPYDDDDEAADPPLGGLLDRREMLRALRLVLRQFRRIERLDVYADYPKLPWSFRTTEAPQLRTLTIRSRTWMDGPMLDYLNGLKMPNLQSFHSWTNPLALRRFIRPTLTSLTISGRDMVPTDGTTVPSAADRKQVILNLLSCVPALARLRVDYVHLIFAYNLQEIAPADRTVSLPALRFLHLTDANAGLPSANLLGHLVVPSETVSIQLVSYKINPSRAVWDQIMAAVKLGEPDSLLAASVMKSTRKKYGVDSDLYTASGVLEIWDAGPQLTSYVPQNQWHEQTPRVSFTTERTYYEPGNYRAPAMSLVPWLPTNRLATYSTNVFMRPETWREQFADAARLRQLHVIGTGSARLSITLSPPHTEYAPEDAGPTLLPALETLVFEQTYWKRPPGEYTTPEDPIPSSNRVARLLEARGGLPQIYIRRGLYLRLEDVQRIRDSGAVVDLDWDGIVTLDADPA